MGSRTTGRALVRSRSKRMNYSCKVWGFYQSVVFGKNHEGLGSVISVRICHFILFYFIPNRAFSLNPLSTSRKWQWRKEGICHSSQAWPSHGSQMSLSFLPWKSELADVNQLIPCSRAHIYLCVSFSSCNGRSNPHWFLFRSDSEGVLGSLENQTFHWQLPLNYINVD